MERAEQGPKGMERQDDVWKERRRAAGHRQGAASRAYPLPSFLVALVQTTCFAMSPPYPEVKRDNFYPPFRETVSQTALSVMRLSKQSHARTSAARLEAAVHSPS